MLSSYWGFLLPYNFTRYYLCSRFDSAFYAATYMGTYQGVDVPRSTSQVNGADRMYKPNSTFDPVYYANKYDDLRGAGFNPA